MRDDMAKMLVETHRTKPLFTYKKRRRTSKQADQENLPTKEGIKDPYGYNTKHFGENFPPLLGYLRKNIGQPWDKVYSNLAKSLKGGGTVIYHTFFHLEHMVDLYPDYRSGKARPLSAYRMDAEYGPNDLYVDKEGILRKGTYVPPKRKAPPKVYHKVGKKEYLKIEGLWFDIVTAPLDKAAQETITAKDVIVGSLWVYKNSFRYRGGIHYNWMAPLKKRDLWNLYSQNGTRRAIMKRQLNSKELKRLKLVNDQP